MMMRNAIAAHVAAKRRRRASKADRTTALFKPAAAPSGVSAIDRVLDFEGGDQGVEPTLCVVADGAGGQNAEYGAIELAGTGTAPTDNSDSAFGLDGSKSTRYAEAQKYHQVGDIATCSPLLLDVFIVAALRGSGELASSGFRLFGSYGGVYAYESAGRVVLRLKSGATTYTVTSSTYTAKNMAALLCCAIDRSGTMRLWTNSVEESNVDVSGLVATSITNGYNFAVGTIGGLAPLKDGEVQYLAYYLTDDIGTHDQQGIVDKLYAQFTGQRFVKSKGIYVPSTFASRSDEILLRKVVDGQDLFVQASSGIPAIEHNADGAPHYAPNNAQVAGPMDNADLSAASWTAAGTATIASMSGPYGLDINCKLTLGGGSANGVAQASAITGATSLGLGLSVKRVSTSGVLTVENADGASGGSWAIDMAELDDGWQWLTADHDAVTETTAFAPVSGNAGLKFYSSDASLVVGVFPTLTKDSPCERPVIVGSALRTTAAETPPAFDGADNVPTNGAIITADISYEGSGAEQGIWSIGDLSTGAVLTVDASDSASLVANESGVAQADISPASALSDGRQRIVSRVKGDAFSVKAEGQDKVTDDSGTMPSDVDPIYLGSKYGANPASSCKIYELRIEAA